MRLVSLSNLQEDARLARDIVSGRDGAPLLRAGVALSARFIDHLQKAGIQAVWVDDELGRGIADSTKADALAHGAGSSAAS